MVWAFVTTLEVSLPVLPETIRKLKEKSSWMSLESLCVSVTV
jgi:hypothetical protein